ncbi:MAG TPA: GxxExxY protein [bacterium]|nr:GxxExxY protein [bacterium]
MSTEKKLLYENLTYRIRGALYKVHKALGPVHKETVYHNAIAIELKRLKIPFETEKVLKVTYRGETVGIYKPDFIIDDKVILEIKAVPAIAKVMLDQIYYYVRGSKYRLVLLANFGARRLEIKRKIYG